MIGARKTWGSNHPIVVDSTASRRNGPGKAATPPPVAGLGHGPRTVLATPRTHPPHR